MRTDGRDETRRKRFPLLPERYHRAAHWVVVVAALIGAIGAAGSGDWPVVGVFVVVLVAAAAAVLLQRPTRPSSGNS